MSLTGTTEGGFRWEIDEAALDDMELLDDIIAVESGEVAALRPLLRRLLGDEQRTRLYEHCRSPETGRVSKTAVMRAVNEIFKALQPGKKS